MFNKNYSNFIPATLSEKDSLLVQNKYVLSGEEARRIYLEEIKDARTSIHHVVGVGYTNNTRSKEVNKNDEPPMPNKDLFMCVQKNKVDILKNVLDKYPEKINMLDDFGWSLLMIACQANSVQTAKELIKRGIDLSIKDKAGNSAYSLVINNKNYLLASILLKQRKTEEPVSRNIDLIRPQPLAQEYLCDLCNKTYPNKEEHLSSTIHNIGVSKDKKIPAQYVIPASNKGYQLMVKGGWDRNSGLGRDGHGKKYPLKTVQKNDKKGLGHTKTKPNKSIVEDNVTHKSRRIHCENLKKNRLFEIHFRRQFY